MAQRLPHELVDLILGQHRLEDSVERKTVARSGLISRDWLPSSRYHLFAQVHLEDHTINSFLDAAHSSPFSLRNFVRSMEIYSKLEYGPERLGELGILPNATSLLISMNRAALAQNRQILSESAPKLTKLALVDCNLPLRCVLYTILAFPSLKSLELRNVNLSYELLPFPSTYPFTTEWSELTLSQFHSEELLKAILALDTVPTFSSLTVDRMLPSVDNSLGEYLRHVGDKLQFLKLGIEEYSATDDMSEDFAALSYSTNLGQLIIEFRLTAIDLSASMLQILPHLQSENLFSIKIMDPLGGCYVNVSHHEQWEELDKALAGAPLENLKTFVVESTATRFVAQLHKLLPLAFARGVLRVGSVQGD
ncbi:hypothetical protein FB45DRAFT_1004998 [Roridomyces roridus]|uniref:Uncharacterized protein n=1 Tax=Roridomyces roridus TaxID=1738132 RepID=A0AAD7FKR6_9AGAR|nr:hypothetical protein FB45DRAFT_1004998 [Roridomyces roridus]